ncbi:MAG: adenylosuccinate lyase [SAR324 cluster bacterium]|nr:adenylosuccinate lyase [SAR324 cluster bacterium]MBL7035999.1 adenylosuccinate lyase [SAR324 cluster bacterium]
MIPDILASRYASKEISEIWSPAGKVRLEREFWIAVMKSQRQLGVDISQTAIADYESVRDQIDLESISAREKKLRHDVKSRIEEFCELAGHEQIHKGLTSRDLTDNVEQLQILRSLRIVRIKAVAVLFQLAKWSTSTKDILLVGRTHNVPAQPTTLGKRLAMFGEEIMFALGRLDHLIENYPLRGLQGAVGTRLDQLVLLNGDKEKVRQLSEQVMQHLDCPASFNAVGQVYPRSLDAETVRTLIGLSSGISSFCRTLRLMAGQGLASEGFQKGQVGSSAMPHKMNARTSERINGFHQILNGYGSMLSGLSGDQWNEGDVSCSVVRRVALPGAFFAADGQLEAFLTVLNEMGFYEAMIAAELQQYLPFLASTALLMEAVRKGGGRESVHEAIKEHAVAVTEKLQQAKLSQNDLAQRLADDQRIPLDLQEIEAVLNDPERFAAAAPEQVEKFAEQVNKFLERFPEAQKIVPEELL